VCISLQRIYVDRAIFDAFLKRLVEVSKKMSAATPPTPRRRSAP
jgi:acyl-CoA reductase-like NAD-dependent aldehyde dehydrogenase